MDRIQEMTKDFMELSSLSEKTKLTNEFIFEKISELDAKYKADKSYDYSIEGVLSNIGSDQESVEVLNCVISRLLKKADRIPKNKCHYDLGNTILAKTAIEYKRNHTIDYLVSTNGYREAIKYFILVQKDGTDHYERALTNIANIYDKHGRNYEALLLYGKVLKANHSFGVALGNQAKSFEYYYRLSPYKSKVLLYNNRQLLEKALKDNNLESIGGKNAVNAFKAKLAEYNEYFAKTKFKPTSPKLPFCTSRYNRFVLKCNLFLNYDFGYYYDNHSLKDSFFPELIEHANEKKSQKNQVMSEKTYYSFQVYNQLLEDYTTARYSFFQALNMKVDDNDKNVNYVYTYDYTRHSIKYGMLKAIFASLYNCLDKAAHLIKYYFGSFESDDEDINFNWLTSREFKEIVIKHDSYQLLALSSLSLDFERGYRYNKFRVKRNRITHSFLTVDEDIVSKNNVDESEITEKQLVEDVFDLFIIVKAVIMYTILAIHLAKKEGNIMPLYAAFEKDIFK